VVEDDLDSLLRGSFHFSVPGGGVCRALTARHSGSHWVFRHECGRPEGSAPGALLLGKGFGFGATDRWVYPFRDGSPGVWWGSTQRGWATGAFLVADGASPLVGVNHDRTHVPIEPTAHGNELASRGRYYRSAELSW